MSKEFRPGWYATSEPSDGKQTFYWFADRRTVTAECYTTSDGRQIFVNDHRVSMTWRDTFRFVGNEAGGRWDNPKATSADSRGRSGTSAPSGVSRCEDPSIPCELCDKKGFAFLPVRRAIVRTDVSNRAPILEAPYNHGFQSPDMASAQAGYSLRLLRPGFLYVFNEVRGVWKAYEVDKDAYLSEFDIDDAPPPEQEQEPVPCGRRATSGLARCVYIPDPKRAGAVWLSFSDTAWTKDVLDKHRREEYRRNHMQCIDVGAWAKGATASMPNIGALADDLTKVAEFHLTIPEPDPNRKGAMVYGGPLATAFSNAPSQHFTAAQVENFKQVAVQSGRGISPAIAAVDDPVGCLLDAKSLMEYRIALFEREGNRDWKKATSVAISGIRKAMEDQKVKEQVQENRNSAMRMVARFGYMPPDGIPDSLTAAEEAGVRAAAWRRYEDDYSEAARVEFDRSLEADMKAFYSGTLTPLAQCFVAWYRSPMFVNAMVCNHDVANAESGRSFTSICVAVTSDATGHQSIFDAMMEDLQGRFDDKANITMRGLCLNNDEAAKRLENSLVAQADFSNPGAWANVLKAFSHVLEKGRGGDLNGGLKPVALFAYNLSGPMVRTLGRAGHGMVSAATRKVIDLAARRRMTSLVAVLSGKPLRRLELSGMSESHLVHSLVESLVHSNPGASRHELRRQVQQAVSNELGANSGARTRTGERTNKGKIKFDWIFFVDDSLRSGSLSQMAVSQETLDNIVRSRTSNYIKLDVGMGVASLILDCWNVYNSYSKIDAPDKEPGLRKGMDLGAALAGFAATSTEVTGMVVRSTTWGSTALSRPFTFFANNVATRAELLGFCGKLLGTAAAVLSATLDIWRALSAYRDGDYPMAIVFGVSALAGGTVAVLILLGTISAGVGFVVLLVLAAISMLAQWLIGLIRDDKVEKWLQKTPFGVETEAFDSLEAQSEAWNALLPEGAQ